MRAPYYLPTGDEVQVFTAAYEKRLPVLLKVSYYGGLSPADYGPDEQGWYERM